MTPSANTGRPLVFGETLFDNFPDGSRVLGGAPFNVAWHLQAFGLAPFMVSRVGDDEEGREIIARMDAWGLDHAGIQTDATRATGCVSVTFSGSGDHDFEIVDDRAYDHIDPQAVDLLPPVSLIYHGSLALRHGESAKALEAIRSASGAPTFVDINLRDPWWSPDVVRDCLDRAHWVKINDVELESLSGGTGSMEERARSFRAVFDLALLIVTQGSKGAFALSAEGGEAAVSPDGTATVVDSVGAGDSFASVLVAGLLRGWPLAETLRRAQTFASAIVGVRGATVDDSAFYAPFVEAWDLSDAN